jgi:hypothetical protein
MFCIYDVLACVAHLQHKSQKSQKCKCKIHPKKKNTTSELGWEQREWKEDKNENNLRIIAKN